MSDTPSTAARVETWVWVLVYGGLGVISVGFALARAGRSYAWGVCGVGAAMTVVGAALVWVRSRMRDDDPA